MDKVELSFQSSECLQPAADAEATGLVIRAVQMAEMPLLEPGLNLNQRHSQSGDQRR